MKHYFKCSSNYHSNSGYTLVELAIVTVIISVLLFTAFNGIMIIKQNLELSSAAQQLEATIKDCQASAFYTGNYFKIDFYPSLDRYRVFEGAVLVKDVQLKNIKLHFTNFTNNKVYFYKTGIPSMGGTVTLKTKYGRTLYVITTPVTARVRVSDKPPANW